jgi:hypothetical protein
MGEDDINRHDQWAVESMGAIQDRTREHLGTSDKVIMAHRRALLKAIDTVEAGGAPPRPAADGPHTVDCIAPADDWEAFWQRQVAQRHAATPWLNTAAGQPKATAATDAMAASASPQRPETGA